MEIQTSPHAQSQSKRDTAQPAKVLQHSLEYHERLLKGPGGGDNHQG